MAVEKVTTVLPAPSKEQLATLKEGEDAWKERTISVDYDFHSGDGEDPSDTFGKPVVNSYFRKGGRVGLQALCRRMLKAGKTEEEINTAAGKYVPSLATSTRQSPEEKITGAFGKMSAEDKKALLLKLGGELQAEGKG